MFGPFHDYLVRKKSAAVGLLQHLRLIADDPNTALVVMLANSL